MTPEELGDVTVLMGATNGKLPPCQVWWPLALRWWGYNGFSLSRGLARPLDQRVI